MPERANVKHEARDGAMARAHVYGVDLFASLARHRLHAGVVVLAASRRRRRWGLRGQTRSLANQCYSNYNCTCVLGLINT